MNNKTAFLINHFDTKREEFANLPTG